MFSKFCFQREIAEFLLRNCLKLSFTWLVISQPWEGRDEAQYFFILPNGNASWYCFSFRLWRLKQLASIISSTSVCVYCLAVKSPCKFIVQWWSDIPMVSRKTSQNWNILKQTISISPLQSGQYYKCLINMNVSYSEYTYNSAYIQLFKENIQI